MDVNVVVLGGRLTRDVELKTSAGGTTIASIGFVVNRRKKDAQGTWTKEPVFVDVKMFGTRAEAFARYHKKGSACMFPHCELRFEQWESKGDGAKRSKLVVVADDWVFVGDGGGASEQHEGTDTPF